MGQKWAPGALQIALGSAPGAKNNSSDAPGGAQGRPWSQISLSGAALGSILASILAPPGGPWGTFFGLFEKSEKCRIMWPCHKNMRSRGSKIEPKSLQNRSKKVSKPKSAPGALLRGHKIDSRTLLGGFGGKKKPIAAPGGPKREFGDRFLSCSKANPTPRGECVFLGVLIRFARRA